MEDVAIVLERPEKTEKQLISYDSFDPNTMFHRIYNILINKEIG